VTHVPRGQEVRRRELALKYFDCSPAHVSIRVAQPADNIAQPLASSRLFELAEAAPVSLSHKDMVALSGETYRLYQESTGTIQANLTHGWLTKHSAALRLRAAPAANIETGGGRSALSL